jgi:hypothetical protein
MARAVAITGNNNRQAQAQGLWHDEEFQCLRVEVDEVPDEGDTTPFPGEDTIMMIYDGCPLLPPLGMHYLSNPSLGTPTHCSWGCRNTGM